MKPKLNVLAKTVNCATPVFEDIPSLKGGVIAPETEVFDATDFCATEKIEEVPYHVFYSSCQRYIDAKIKNENLTPSDLFFQNTDGHMLINASIVLIYLRFMHPDVSIYFDNIVASCLIGGAAFSDSFVAKLAMTQLTSKDLKDIIDLRNENGNAAEQQQ